jgi:hypothetical protein
MLSKNIPPGAFVIRKHPDGKFIRPRANTRDAPSPGIASLSSSTLIIELQTSSVKYVFGHFLPARDGQFSKNGSQREEALHLINPYSQLVLLVLNINPTENTIQFGAAGQKNRPFVGHPEAGAARPCEHAKTIQLNYIAECPCFGGCGYFRQCH